MLAARYHKALIRSGSTLHVSTVLTQRPAAHDVVVAPRYVGICGTDLQILNGARPDIAPILGHEGCGVIVETGAGSTLRVGEHVVFNPAAELPFDRILGHNVPGLFQRLITVSAQSIQNGLILPAPPSTSPLCEALIEPLAAVVYAHELVSRARRELRSVVIFGAGAFGLLAALYLRSLGVRTVVAHPHRSRLDHAVSRELLDSSCAILVEENAVPRLLEANGGCTYDASLVCTTRVGVPTALELATAIVGNEGCIDLVANLPENARLPVGLASIMLRGARAANTCGTPFEGYYTSSVIAGKRLWFTGHRGTSRAHLKAAMAALAANPASYSRVITHTFTLEQAADAIHALAYSSERKLNGHDCIKAVVDVSGSNAASSH